jgi:hypothetical protein
VQLHPGGGSFFKVNRVMIDEGRTYVISEEDSPCFIAPKRFRFV